MGQQHQAICPAFMLLQANHPRALVSRCMCFLRAFQDADHGMLATIDTLEQIRQPSLANWTNDDEIALYVSGSVKEFSTDHGDSGSVTLHLPASGKIAGKAGIIGNNQNSWGILHSNELR